LKIQDVTGTGLDGAVPLDAARAEASR
jgi:hypothetical protein